MIKIFFLLMIVSMPGEPTVKYNASIYPTEEFCMLAQEGYMGAYEAKPQEYKDKMKTEAFCIPFDSFPIKGMEAYNMGA